MIKYRVMGSYINALDELVTLRGDLKHCSFIDGVNGDGSDEFDFNVGIQVIVKAGVEVGLWEVVGSELHELDQEKWDAFYDKVDQFIIDNPEEDYE